MLWQDATLINFEGGYCNKFSSNDYRFRATLPTVFTTSIKYLPIIPKAYCKMQN